MLIGTADIIVGPYGALKGHVPKSDAVPHDKFNSYVVVSAKYLGLPQGAIVRVTLEIVTHEEKKT